MSRLIAAGLDSDLAVGNLRLAGHGLHTRAAQERLIASALRYKKSLALAERLEAALAAEIESYPFPRLAVELIDAVKASSPFDPLYCPARTGRTKG